MKILTIPDHVDAVISRLENAGCQAYAVGGAVRDCLLGLEPEDWDLCTSALPEETEEIFSDCRVIPTGLKHGTVTVIYDNHMMEITTFRSEGAYSDGRHPDQVTFVSTLEEDLARRDFTINAMAYAPSKGLIDIFGGQKDLRNGVLRCVGTPELRFEEDALRILRGLRFMSVMDLIADSETSEAMLKCRELLRGIAYERIDVELLKLLGGDSAVQVMDRYRDIFAVIIPELEQLFDFDQSSPFHNRDVWQHTLAAVDDIPNDPELRLVMLFHDIAKPVVASFDSDGRGHFLGHQEKGSEMAEQIMRRMKFSNEEIRRATLLIKHHDTRFEADRPSVRRMLSKLGEPLLRDLLIIQRADAAGKHERYLRRAESRMENIRALLDDIISSGDCYNLSMLDVNGRDLRGAGITDGKTVGAELDRLLDDVIEERIPNKKPALIKAALERMEECQRYV